MFLFQRKDAYKVQSGTPGANIVFLLDIIAVVSIACETAIELFDLRM